MHERIKWIKKYGILWVYGIHWKQIMSNCHYTSCHEIHGGTTLVNIHCPFSPSAQICSQANWPHWSQATKCLQTLAKQIPTPQTKRTTLMILMNMFDTLSSPGTLLFKNAKRPCIVSHGGEHGWENETQVMDMWYVPAVQRNECVLNQGPPSKTKHCENSKIGFWDCNQFMRTCKQYKATSKNHQNPENSPLWISENLCTLWNQDHQLTHQASDRLPKPNPSACFQHAAGPLLHKRFCPSNPFLALEIQGKGDKSADDNVSNQVWQVPSCCDSVFDLYCKIGENLLWSVCRYMWL